MPVAKKNFGPCLVTNCIYKNVSFRLITELAYQKCREKNMLETYPYLEVGKQLCHLHYCNIVEPNRGQYKRKRLDSQKCSRKKAIQIEDTREEGNAIDISYKTTIKKITNSYNNYLFSFNN